MNQIIAAHGWGGDSNCWELWQEEFKKNGWLWQSLERGYGEKTPFKPDWEIKDFKNKKNRRVIIGHSLGPHLLSKTTFTKATDFIFICSFGRFIPDRKERFYMKNALEKMFNLIGTDDEENMLKRFLKKAISPELESSYSSGPIANSLSVKGREKLRKDLRLLIESKGLPTRINSDARILVIEGEKDLIVDRLSTIILIRELESQVNQKITHRVIPNGGHFQLNSELLHLIKDWLTKYL